MLDSAVPETFMHFVLVLFFKPHLHHENLKKGGGGVNKLVKSKEKVEKQEVAELTK